MKKKNSLEDEMDWLSRLICVALKRYLFVISPFYLDELGYDFSVFRIILCCLILLICTPNIYDFLLI